MQSQFRRSFKEATGIIFTVKYNSVYFSFLSALCGLHASAGGTIFKFEDGICTVGNYLGSPADYEDGLVSITYFFLVN